MIPHQAGLRHLTAQPAFAPAHDPPGFDRAAYHPQLNAQIAAFLEPQRHVPGW
jgi:hypothetical protein